MFFPEWTTVTESVSFNPTYEAERLAAEGALSERSGGGAVLRPAGIGTGGRGNSGEQGTPPLASASRTRDRDDVAWGCPSVRERPRV